MNEPLGIKNHPIFISLDYMYLPLKTKPIIEINESI